jgi:hypothetical protein
MVKGDDRAVIVFLWPTLPAGLEGAVIVENLSGVLVIYPHCRQDVEVDPTNMPPKKTPTSSLSGSPTSQSTSHRLTITTTLAVELLIKRIWYRSKARIQRMRSGGAPPGTRATSPSPVMELPMEVVELIIAQLFYHSPTLRSCSLTCRSWYITTLPHLHSTFITHSQGEKYRWPNPIRHMHRLGLLPLVKTVLIRHDYDIMGFSLKRFDRRSLRQSSALTNVQTLEIDELDIPSFMPKIRQYFAPFLPTLRALYLREPAGSNRQIIFFVGLFQHLESLSLHKARFRRREPEDPTLTPPFAPPLQGQLTALYWVESGLFQDMVNLFGGMRFSAMNLFQVDETRLLLDACAETLRVLRLHPNDPHGGQCYLKHVRFQANDPIAESSLRDFDLSRITSLRNLEVPVCSLDSALRAGSLDTASKLLKHTLPTIQSPVFSQVRVIYEEDDFPGKILHFSPVFGLLLPPREAMSCHKRFEVLREVLQKPGLQVGAAYTYLGV